MTATQTPSHPLFLLLIRPSAQRYAVRRDDVAEIRRIASAHEIARLGTPERPAVPVPLGALLGESEDRPANQALIVMLRRRPVVFLIHQIETFIERAAIEPLPDLIRRSLSQPWSIGVLPTEDGPAVVLDLRAIARSVLAAKAVREE
jgi:hypothetical protein